MCNRRFLLYTGSKFSCSELFVINSSCHASPCKPGSCHNRHTAVRLAAKAARSLLPASAASAAAEEGGVGNEVTVSGTLLSMRFS